MITAFVDMVGLLMVLPLLPFYAVKLGGGGLIVGVLVSSFAIAQLLSAPLWGRVSDRYGRRPALLIGLAAAAVAYVVFALADSLWLLLLSRLVQGAGGGTVGVIQAYVADSTEPENRAKSLGWLSAATNLGVMIGPAIGSYSQRFGDAAPGFVAAGLCLLNMGFAWAYLRESNVVTAEERRALSPVRSREAVARVLAHPGEPSSRMIWIYAIGMGAFQGMTSMLALFLARPPFGMTEDNVWMVFTFNGAISVLARAVLLGRAVDRFGEARLSRLGQLLLATGLLALPFTRSWVTLAAAMALVPLGTAFTFPCVTAILSRVIDRRERGVIMGVQQSFGGVARVVSPLWAGWAFEHLGVGVPFWTGSLLVLGTMMLGFGIEEYTRPAPEPESAPAVAG